MMTLMMKDKLWKLINVDHYYEVSKKKYIMKFRPTYEYKSHYQNGKVLIINSNNLFTRAQSRSF